jgi:aminoglycoside N3'-acetyltransferase
MRAFIRVVVFNATLSTLGIPVSVMLVTMASISSVDQVALNTTTIINALITMFTECIYLPCV